MNSIHFGFVLSPLGEAGFIMKTKNLIVIFILLIALAGGLVVFLAMGGDSAIEHRQFNEGQTEQIITVKMLIDGAEYQAAVKPDSSVYDLMSSLKEQGLIDFQDHDYAGLGFFIEEINGVKNDPAGANWFYYVDGKLAPVGASSYKLKNNDLVEWKYEARGF